MSSTGNDLLTYLRGARHSSNVVYSDLLRQYDPRRNDVHIFYEGYDDPAFYNNCFRAVNLNERQMYYYPSRNKDGVYQNYGKIDWSTYSKSNIWFFVDRDFSDIIPIVYPVDTNIYVTDQYSIESHLVNERLFDIVLMEIYRVTDSALRVRLCNFFNSQQAFFYSELRSYTSYLIYHKRLGHNLNLSNVRISDLFSINDATVKLERSRIVGGRTIIEHLDFKFQISTTNAWKGLAGVYRELKELEDEKKYVRGKYDVWFFVSFMKKMIAHLNTNLPAGEAKYKGALDLNANNVVALLSPRSVPPQSLIDFINGHLN